MDARRGREASSRGGDDLQRAAVRSVAGAARGPFRERRMKRLVRAVATYRRTHHHACRCCRSLWQGPRFRRRAVQRLQLERRLCWREPRLPVGQGHQLGRRLAERHHRRRADRLQLASSSELGARPRGRHPGLRRRRHLRGLQVRQSVVRHAARPRRLRDEQRAGLSRPAASPTAAAASSSQG